MLIVDPGVAPVEEPAVVALVFRDITRRFVFIVLVVRRQIVELHQTGAELRQVAEFVFQLHAALRHVVRRNGGVRLRRDVPVVGQDKLEAFAAAIFRVRDQEAGAAAIADRQLQIGAVEDRHRAQLKAGIPDLRHLFFAILDNLRAHDAPAVVAGQTGGETAVFQNGVAVIGTLLHQIGVAASLTTHHLVVAVPDVSVFGIQIRPGFRTFQDDLIVVIAHITQRVDGANRRGLSFLLALMQLHLIRLQAAVALLYIHVAGEYRVVRIVSLRRVGMNRDRQLVCLASDQRAVIARHAQHTLRHKIVGQSRLTGYRCANHGGQQGR